MERTAKASDAAAKSAEELAEKMGPALDEVGNAAKNFDSQYGEYLDNIADRINTITTAINALKAALAGEDYSLYLSAA